mmetsp:Transcript_21955/g.34103  ORF Transcript_21955/g.34103 Transcript_21955/m.34103 type:complete len:399 (+) Transcript_21955:2478-3674(+)
MRENIEKEKELLEQLEDARANDGGDADPKGKGKGKATKSPQEIQQEIDDLKALEVNGWILIDFPRNLNQSKLLEHEFTGFELNTDSQKPNEVANFETWTKFTDPTTTTSVGYEGDISAQHSLFDGIFMLDAPKEECFRRAQHRQIDPTTGTVYHQQDSPAPEGDAKLHERLTNFYGQFASEDDMIQKLDLNHIHFTDNEMTLKKFYEAFGSFDYGSRKGILSFSSVTSEQGKSKEDIFTSLSQKLTEIIAFKQIAQDRRYQEVKDKIKQEEEEKLAAEASAADFDAAHASQPIEEAADKVQVEEDKQSVDIIHKDKRITEHMASKTSLQSKVSNHLSHSKVSSGGIASKKQKKRIEFTRDFKIKTFEEMETAYIREGILAINDIKRQRGTVIDHLNQS